MTKKRIVFFVVTIALLTGLATQVHGQMRRNIFRVGGSLGYCYALFQLDQTDPDIFSKAQRLQDNAERWLRAIIREYTPPFSSDGLQNILSRLERFDPQTSRTHVNNRQRANFYPNIRDGVKESLALTYGHETRNRFQKEPTCESALLYIGYHFGEWLVYTDYEQENLRRRSISSLTRAVNNGKQVAATLKCALMDLSVFDRINFATASKNDVKRINDELERAINNLAAGNPIRTSPSQKAVASGSPEGKWQFYNKGQRKWIYRYFIYREGDHYIGKYIWNGRVETGKESKRRHRLPAGGPWCFGDETILFKVSAQPQFQPSLNRQVFQGDICAEGPPWSRSTFQIWLDGDILRMRYYSTRSKRWHPYAGLHRVK